MEPIKTNPIDLEQPWPAARAIDLLRHAQFDDILVLAIILVATVSWRTRGVLWATSSVDLDFFFQVPQAGLGSGQDAGSKRRQTRDVSVVMQEAKKDMVIFWGSQSGTAENLACRLARELEFRFGLKVLTAGLDEYDHAYLSKLPPEKVVGFIVSTYGEGDPPDNAHEFWNLLGTWRGEQARLPNLQYVIFGLGNSQYRCYNRVVDTVEDALRSVGASRIGGVGKGDDAQGGTEEDFMAWRSEVCQALQKKLQLQEQERSYRPSYKVEELSIRPDERSLFLGEPHSSLLVEEKSTRHRDPSLPVILPVAEARELFRSTDRNCLHMELDMRGVPWVKYQTGDHVAIWPINPDGEVALLLQGIGLETKRDRCISISLEEQTSATKSHLFSPTTIDALLRYYLEICAPVSRDLVSALRPFAPTEAAKEKLDSLADDRDSFNGEIASRCITLAKLLQEVGGGSQWNIPLSFLIENLKKLQPRCYSISSSALVQPRQISVTAVVSTHTPNVSDEEQVVCGLTTNYLLALKQRVGDGVPAPKPHGVCYSLQGPRSALGSNSVYAQIRRSKFKLPSKHSTSIIMVGAGTGVAPFRAFVQERGRLRKLGNVIGKMILIVGARREEEDFLYAEEWLRQREVLGDDDFQVWTAFSREDTDRKVYVQDRLADHKDEVMQLLDEEDRSTIYICGAAAMARDVASCLARIRSQKVDASIESGESWVSSLRQSGRLQEDVWG